MCIRDRDEALAFYTQKLGWEVRSDVSMNDWDFRWLVVGPAVSYTHLRAHETVLDLVCRLLLEKNNDRHET